MSTVNIHDAKTHLSRLLEDVAKGEDVVIARAGRPIARIVPFDRGGKRKLGALDGQIRIPEDFDSPLPDEVLDTVQGR